MNWKSIIALLVVLTILVACKSTQHSPAVVNLPEYGVSDTNSIRIRIVGDVNNPGDYWVSMTVSLASLPNIAGGWTGHGEFGVSPTRALVKNQSSGQRDQRIYHLKKMSREEQEAVRFRDGDEIYFPRVLF